MTNTTKSDEERIWNPHSFDFVWFHFLRTAFVFFCFLDNDMIRLYNETVQHVNPTAFRERQNQMKSNEPIFAEERKQKILEIVNQEKKIVVPELTERFGVSATTIRKDLKELEIANLLLRTHGGAISISKTSYEGLPANKAEIMQAQKRAIALAALEYIEDGDTIALMTGTTVMELVKLLDKRSQLTVVVNDLLFGLYLEQNTNCRVFMLSGIIRNKYNYVTSPMPCELLSMLNIDKAFITCNGFSASMGATTPDLENALKIREVLSRSSSTYLLCDSSKIGLASFAQIAPTKDIDLLITDDGLSDDDAANYTSGVRMVVAQTDNAEA